MAKKSNSPSANFGTCGIYFVSERGRGVAASVSRQLEENGASCTTAELKSKPGQALLSHREFTEHDILIFIASTGIAVRAIAPYIKDKQKDPAVVVIDESGKFVVPIIGGHIRRGNELATFLAGALSAVAAITTASDNLNISALDVFAEKTGLKIHPAASYKRVAARLNAGEKATFILDKSDRSANTRVIKALGSTYSDSFFIDRGSFDPANTPSGPIVCLKDASYCLEKNVTCDLTLSPKKYAIGLGFRKDAPASDLLKAVQSAIEIILDDAGSGEADAVDEAHASNVAALEAPIMSDLIICISTIDIKKGAPALDSASRSLGIPVKYFSADKLQKTIEADSEAFSTSKPALDNFGINGVCEPAAVLATSNGKLIMKKRILWGVTVAVARENCL